MIFIIVIVLIIFIFLMINVHFTIYYDGEILVRLKFLFFVYDLINNNNNFSNKDEEQDIDSKKVSNVYDKFTSKFKRSNKLSEFLSIILKMTKIIINKGKNFLKKIVIYKCHMKIDVVSSDAYNVAVNYGKVCSIIYPLLNLLDIRSKCKDFYLDIRPVFIENQYRSDEVKYDIRFKTRIINIFCFVISIFIDYIK